MYGKVPQAWLVVFRMWEADNRHVFQHFGLGNLLDPT